MAIDYPYWYSLKSNIVSILEEIATEEAAEDSARNFNVSNSRWFPWIEGLQSVALANVMVQNVGPNPARSQARKYKIDQIEVMVDMYAIGKSGETLPADEVAAQRLDLLTNQVREGLTRLKKL